MGKKKASSKNANSQKNLRKTYLGSDSSEEQNIRQADSDPWGYSKGYPQISEERLSPGPKQGSREKQKLLGKQQSKKPPKKKGPA